MRPLINTLWICVLTLGAPIVAVADDARSAVADPAVLAHRITKSACLVLSGAEAEVHVEDIRTSSAALLAAVADMGERGSDPSEVAQIQQLADVLVRSARQIGAGDRHSVPVRLLLSANPELVLAIASAEKAGDGRSSPDIARAMHAVNDLRIVSQALQRDLCLLYARMASPDAIVGISDRIASFAPTLDALMVGDRARGLDRAPNVHIKITLDKAARKWATLAPILKAAANGDDVDLRDVKLASVLGDAILKNLDDVAARYAAL